jgi:hypothetical protein
MACDICGNNKKSLIDLREIYQTDKVKQVCPSCEGILNKQLSKIQLATTNIQIGWFKNFISQFKESINEHRYL